MQTLLIARFARGQAPTAQPFLPESAGSLTESARRASRTPETACEHTMCAMIGLQAQQTCQKGVVCRSVAGR